MRFFENETFLWSYMHADDMLLVSKDKVKIEELTRCLIAGFEIEDLGPAKKIP